jgi:hypothetical protein
VKIEKETMNYDEALAFILDEHQKFLNGKGGRKLTFHDKNLCEVSFKSCDLSETEFLECFMRNSSFKGSNLENAWYGINRRMIEHMDLTDKELMNMN